MRKPYYFVVLDFLPTQFVDLASALPSTARVLFFEVQFFEPQLRVAVLEAVFFSVAIFFPPCVVLVVCFALAILYTLAHIVSSLSRRMIFCFFHARSRADEIFIAAIFNVEILDLLNRRFSWTVGYPKKYTANVKFCVRARAKNGKTALLLCAIFF